jgi:hypothetical protein
VSDGCSSPRRVHRRRCWSSASDEVATVRHQHRAACQLLASLARLTRIRDRSAPAPTVNAELAEPADGNRFCSATSAVAALNVGPCGGVSWSDTLLATLPVHGETRRIDRRKNAARVDHRVCELASARVRLGCGLRGMHSVASGLSRAAGFIPFSVVSGLSRTAVALFFR